MYLTNIYISFMQVKNIYVHYNKINVSAKNLDV
jgi:hypothetical protein